jgi:hypothetical protein
MAAAVDRYTDIPAVTRTALKARMAEQRYDDIAVIGRDHITGRYRYGGLRDMHFGTGRVCRTVTRLGWPAQAQERGLVYCEAGHCIIVPTVCRNVSRVTRQGAVAAQLPGAGGASAAAARDGSTTPPQTLAVVPEGSELHFAAPSAGRAVGAPGEALAWTGPEAMTLPGSSMGGPAGGPGAVPGDAASADPGGETPPAVVTLASTEPLDLNGGASFAGLATGNRPANDAQTFAGPPLPLLPLLPYGGFGGSSFLPLPAPAQAAPVPEPASVALMALGLATLARHAARRRARSHGPHTPPP